MSDKKNLPPPIDPLLQAPFMLDGVRVDPVAHRVYLKSRTLKLQPQPMQVLLLLAAAHGKVVLRTELLAQVWDGALPNDEVLTKAISKLRKALGDAPQAPTFIETIPKVGYRLLVQPVAVPVPSLLPPRPSVSRDRVQKGWRSPVRWLMAVVLIGSLSLLAYTLTPKPAPEPGLTTEWKRRVPRDGTPRVIPPHEIARLRALVDSLEQHQSVSPSPSAP